MRRQSGFFKRKLSGGVLQPEDIACWVRFILEQPPHGLVPRILVVPSAQPV